MSRAASPSAKKPYGLQRVCRVWRIPRSTAQRHRAQQQRIGPPPPDRRRGPASAMTDETLLDEIRSTLQASPWSGQGYRKTWAQLRHRGIRTAARRVLRLMRDHGLLAPTRAGRARGPRTHDGTIIPEAPDRRWGTDATSVMTGEGRATVFILVDHFTGECLGIHAARVGTRFEALEPLRQAVPALFGSYRSAVAADAGLELRHDHGSQYTSDVFQDELAFLGITSSPSYVRAPEGNGSAERFIRTLKEQLLWLERFDGIESLTRALHDFRERFNQTWIMHRHGFRTPAQVRAEHATTALEAAA